MEATLIGGTVMQRTGGHLPRKSSNRMAMLCGALVLSVVTAGGVALAATAESPPGDPTNYVIGDQALLDQLGYTKVDVPASETSGLPANTDQTSAKSATRHVTANVYQTDPDRRVTVVTGPSSGLEALLPEEPPTSVSLRTGQIGHVYTTPAAPHYVAVAVTEGDDLLPLAAVVIGHGPEDAVVAAADVALTPGDQQGETVVGSGVLDPLLGLASGCTATGYSQTGEHTPHDLLVMTCPEAQWDSVFASVLPNAEPFTVSGRQAVYYRGDMFQLAAQSLNSGGIAIITGLREIPQEQFVQMAMSLAPETTP